MESLLPWCNWTWWRESLIVSCDLIWRKDTPAPESIAITLAKASSLLMALQLIYVGLDTLWNSGRDSTFDVPQVWTSSCLWNYPRQNRELLVGLAILLFSFMGRWKITGILILVIVSLEVVEPIIQRYYGLRGLPKILIMHLLAIPIIGTTSGLLMAYSLQNAISQHDSSPLPE